MTTSQFCSYVSFVVSVSFIASGFAQDEPPRPTDPRLKIELFAESPQIVTPTGIDVDHTGRVWAIESNTHFPPDDYKGHPTDRILVMEGRNAQGKAEKFTVFKDGLTHTMSIAVKPVWLEMNPAIPSENEKETKPTPVAHSPNATEVFIATRREIFHCSDTDGDLKCDEVKSLVRLETSGNYPHNGLAGFAFDAQGKMFFGFGENLGADYKLIGSDGVTISGGGEGGSIFRCQPDGSKLERWATGFWNPHASCFDAFGNLFTLDNDPDSRPPCRLLHIIQEGDYGYRFRNGRKGTHPFTAWNGEVPGTLPMVSGTGEAPSGIVCYESDGLPEDYQGTLLVGSWGDHRIDKFVLNPRGTSFESQPQPIIKGGENFRPVGLAIAPDGSLYVTDWVSKEYKLHGLGRIWRVSAKEEPHREVIDAAKIDVPKTLEELQNLSKSRRLDIRRVGLQKATASGQFEDWTEELVKIESKSGVSKSQPSRLKFEVAPSTHSEDFYNFHTVSDVVGKRWFIVGKYYRNRLSDPFVFTTVLQYFLRGHAPAASWEEWILGYLDNPREDSPPRRESELMLGLAGRRKFPKSLAIPRKLVASSEPTSRWIGVQWIGEEHLTELRPDVEKVLTSEPMTGDLFMACLASLSLLDGVLPSEFEKAPPTKHIFPIVSDPNRPASLRAIALRVLPTTFEELNAKLMSELLASSDTMLQREVVRTLGESKVPEREQLLRGIVANPSLDLNLRADAIAALAGVTQHGKFEDATRDLLIELLSSDKQPTLRIETLRSLRRLASAKSDDPNRDSKVIESLEKLRSSVAQEPDATRRVISESLDFAAVRSSTPSIAEILEKVVSSEQSQPDSDTKRESIESGRRNFYHANGAGCYKCHTIGGRGGQVGPDLTVIARTMNRKKLAESILEPSKEISPQFTSWTIQTTSGKTLVGMLLGEEVNGDLRLGNSQGEVFFVPFNQIETRSPMKTSIMPEKLHETMTSTELQDLINYLETLK